jgi:hypothetical protein
MALDELDVSGIPAIDGHCHPFPADASRSISADLLRDAISVSLRGTTSPLNETMVLSRVAVRELAAFLGCDPSYEAVVAARNAAAEDAAAFVDRLFAAQGVAGLLVDPGFPAIPTIDAAEFAARVPVPVWEGYRIERFFPMAGSFHGDASSPPERPFAEVLEVFAAELDAQARRPGFAYFKSIMAYRTGLAIRPVSDAEVARAWQDHRAYGDAEEKIVRDYLFRVTCAKAREHGVPFQLHTGHTSHVNTWPNVNPILLTPVLNEREIAETPLVILHAGYPYCAEAGYLTSVYPNLACDLSLMIPWASGGVARRIGEVLESAPVAKLTYGSDAIHLPEMNWLGALVGRRGLATALATLVADRLLTAGEAEDAAEDILHRNAERIYDLDARSPVPPSSSDVRVDATFAVSAAERMGA